MSGFINQLLYVIHITACLYFAMSTVCGIGSNGWTYDGTIETKYVSAYLRCFYWALKTVTSIGNEKIPTTKLEIGFSMMNYIGSETTYQYGKPWIERMEWRPKNFC